MIIKKYTHYPNATECGLGNTNESYLLISKDFDLSDIFPSNIPTSVTECSTNKQYVLKSKIGTEFRINQLGPLYRDFDIHPGDELEFVCVKNNEKNDVYVSITKYNRVFLNVTTKGTEIIGIDRLDSFKTPLQDGMFCIPISEGILSLEFEKSEKKRSDSPATTDFYKAMVNEVSLNKGLYFVNIEDNNTLIDAVKGKYIEFILDDKQEEPSKFDVSDLPLQQIVYGAPGTGKSFGTDDKIHEVYPEKSEEEKKYVFRTTFHPDSDYSTFVGCYKPTKENIGALTLHKLHEIYPEFKAKAPARPLHRFIAKYHNSFSRLTEKEAESIFSSIETDSTITAEVPKCMALIEELPETTNISYSFVPQTFTKAYIASWKAMINKETLTDKDGNVFTKPIFLVVEEINRGNCAQIFGDLFQLLDRNGSGFSTYPIKPDTDLGNYILEEFLKQGITSSEYDSILKGEDLLLPPNLHIWATMNTSDQSLFPIDSAFKRRWDWKYVPIKYDNKDWNIVLNEGEKVKWVDLQTKLNELIYDATESEDKMIGDWFVKAKDNEIDEETLVGKIIFYLWNDVAKVDAGKLFNLNMKELKGKDRNVIFSDFYTASGNINSEVVKAWLIDLGFEIDETLDNGKPAETSPEEINKVTYSRPEYAGILQGIEEKCKENGLTYKYYDSSAANSMGIKFDKYPYSTLEISVALDKTGTPSADVKLWIEATPKAIETRDKLRENGAGEFFASLVTEESLSYEEMAKDAADDMNKVRGWRLRNTAITFAEANAMKEAEWLFDIVTKIRERFADAL